MLHASVIMFFRNFFLEPSHPVNLAIFRVVLFYLILSSVNFSNLQWLGDVPKVLITPPLGFDWFPSVFKIETNWLVVSSYIFKITCIFSILGLFTRYSIAITAVLAFYLLGVPNFFGKVNHNHHLVLFATIMIVCRCSDVWSLDALINYFRTKKITIPKPSVVYGLPIRIIWVMFGVLYFFAGFWKIYDGGLDWIFSNNLKYYMYQTWYLNDWMPGFRIDQHPTLITISAALTILFEIGFIFLIFMGRLRYLGVLGGLMFHNMTNMFMNINFKSLWYCYVIFFEWSFLYRWYFKIIYGNKENYEETQVVKVKYQTIVISLVGGILIFGNVYAGFNNYVNTWFFSCYPTFQYVKTSPNTRTLSIETSLGDGEFEKIDENAMKAIGNKFQYARFNRMIQMIIREKDENKFIALWGLVKSENPELNDIKSVRIYEETVTTIPNLLDKNPLERKLLAEFHDL